MKIICVETNYTSRNKEMFHTLFNNEPVISLKVDSSLLKDGKPFYIPGFSSDVQYETEIVVRINRLGKNIAQRFACRYYNEITVGIDMTAKDLQQQLKANAHPWELSKAFDNSAIIGKFISLEEVDNDINNLPFHLDINGITVQEGNTNDQIFKIDEIIAYVSRFFTLKMGDLIYTGTPAGGGKVNINDHLQGYIRRTKLLDFYVK
ncbi:MAG: fumarylacetoacetate hydrolase family protein [Dysgonamonadaceae bacterium]|jgi:2-keto-4-pentenoate hydratase/2-oxohepta-3-ene-1,7-dioic acid hydratase in catechol pathway|nr:fumarylacetoacetate hydrolase family protein [Dysgonamonadaceae bacterium]